MCASCGDIRTHAVLQLQGSVVPLCLFHFFVVVVCVWRSDTSASREEPWLRTWQPYNANRTMNGVQPEAELAPVSLCSILRMPWLVTHARQARLNMLSRLEEVRVVCNVLTIV